MIKQDVLTNFYSTVSYLPLLSVGFVLCVIISRAINFIVLNNKKKAVLKKCDDLQKRVDKMKAEAEEREKLKAKVEELMEHKLLLNQEVEELREKHARYKRAIKQRLN